MSKTVYLFSVMLIMALVFVLAVQADGNRTYYNADGSLLYPNAMVRYGDTDNACDPTGNNPAWPPCSSYWDNECYSGGSMAGMCESEYEWELGWWLARFYQGHVEREEIPEPYRPPLPPTPTPEPTRAVFF